MSTRGPALSTHARSTTFCRRGCCPARRTARPPDDRGLLDERRRDRLQHHLETLGGRELSTDACIECNPIVTVSGNSAVSFGAAIASRYQSGENADDCMIATVSAEAVPGFDPDVWAARLEALGGGGAVSDLGGGCGLGGTTSVGGAAAVGNTSFDVRLTGATGALGGVLVLDVSPRSAERSPASPASRSAASRRSLRPSSTRPTARPPLRFRFRATPDSSGASSRHSG